MSIDISINWLGSNAALVRVRGDFDIFNAPRVKKTLSELIKRGRQHLLINLEEVAFIDLHGLGTLICELKHAQSYAGTLRVVCTNPKIVKVFNVTGLVDIFPLFNDENAALHSWEDVA